MVPWMIDVMLDGDVVVIVVAVLNCGVSTQVSA
jgi:hypothetical protein